MSNSPRSTRPLGLIRLALALASSMTLGLGLGLPDVRAQAPPKAQAQAEATLRAGDNGAAVEGLQRQLNAKLVPSPALDVDGDFGAATQAAVTRFQRSNGLRETGVADPVTRRLLGPAPAPESAVPSPESVNARAPVKQPADLLEGPPFTLAGAWAVADGKTGATLWGHLENKSLEMASTTKMMTALVVLRLVQADPKVLDETVTFSERADQTVGSTSGVKAGESLTVRELLYGLLLPSGNDAAEAFAEHFNARLAAGTSPAAEVGPIARFVAAMNREAAAIGLHESHFANPHGLPAEGHHSSARDLAKLAQVALQDPTFARVVATTRRGARLVDAAGRTRDVVWTNTNRLLEFEGYDGVKTGTTNNAGACLVASGRFAEGHLIVVILGAPTSDARYADARNLFRWARQQLARRPPNPSPNR